MAFLPLLVLIICAAISGVFFAGIRYAEQSTARTIDAPFKAAADYTNNRDKDRDNPETDHRPSSEGFSDNLNTGNDVLSLPGHRLSLITLIMLQQCRTSGNHTVTLSQQDAERICNLTYQAKVAEKTARRKTKKAAKKQRAVANSE